MAASCPRNQGVSTPKTRVATREDRAYDGPVRRLGSFASVLVLGAVSASAALAVSPPIKYRPVSGPVGAQRALKVTVSSHRQGAKPVTVTLSYSGPLRCGRPM